MPILDGSIIAQQEAELELAVEMWTRVNTTEPTERQLKYLLFLSNTKQGVDTSFWKEDHLDRRRVGAIINALLKLPDKVRDIRCSACGGPTTTGEGWHVCMVCGSKRSVR